MKCRSCKLTCQKAGRQKNGTQKFYCRHCCKYQQAEYIYQAYQENTDQMIRALLCEGVGIRGIGRILQLCTNTVLLKIKRLASLCHAPATAAACRDYEIDELRTYIGSRKNECWVIYCMDRHTKVVTAFTVGRRTKEQVRKITDPLIACTPGKVYTDRLPLYRSLLPSAIHGAGNYCTNRIERNNLNIRTHLKRLARKTICFSKNIELLEACLRIYLWSDHRI